VATWFDYSRVWAAHPWVLVYAVIVAVVFVIAVVGTVIRGPLALLFIPSLAGLYGHHLMVQKRL
jgi:hypothetical protein